MRPNEHQISAKGLAIGVGVLLALWAVWAVSPPGQQALRASTPAPTRTAPPRADGPCQDAVARVQAYRAPGSREPLEATLLAQLLREPGAVAVQGWAAPQELSAPYCLVFLRVSLHNEPVLLGWRLDRDTGRVEATDDRTRRLSGW